MRTLKFLLLATGFAIAVFFIYYVLISFSAFTPASFDWQIVLSVWLVTILSFIIVSKIGQIDSSFFFAAILSSIVFRLLLFGGVNFALIYFDRDNAINNVVLFFVVYFIFTILENLLLFKEIKVIDQVSKESK